MKMEVEMGIAVEIEMKAEMEIAVRKHRYFWFWGMQFAGRSLLLNTCLMLVTHAFASCVAFSFLGDAVRRPRG